MTNSQYSLALGVTLAVIASLLLFALLNEPGDSDEAAAGGSYVQRTTEATAGGSSVQQATAAAAGGSSVQQATAAAAGGSSVQEATAVAAGGSPVQRIEIAGRYIKADEAWVVVVAPNLKSRQALISLAKTVWAQEKGARGVQIFDDKDFEPYVRWTKDWPFSAEEYPAQWAKKHHIGMVNRQFTAGRAPGDTRVFLTVYQEEKFGGWALID